LFDGADRPPNSPLFPYTTLFRSVSSIFPAEESAGGARPLCHGIGTGDEINSRYQMYEEVSGQALAVIGETPPAEETFRAERFFRSEEHTSELQSRENLVCRLLLE